MSRGALAAALAAAALAALGAAQRAPQAALNEFAQRTQAGLKPAGFRNPYYQALSYHGSRVLEWNQTRSFAEYVEVIWSQAVTVDVTSERIWLADAVYHQVIMVEPSTRYIKWPAYYIQYAGQRGMKGHTDGSRLEAKFNSPLGIAVADSGRNAIIFVADTNNHCLRRLDFRTGRTSTIAGYVMRPGLRDGFGLETRFRFPTSMGVDAERKNLFVLDNGQRIRHVDISESPHAVKTLVGGACRAVGMVTLPPSYRTVILRRVACHPDWDAKEAGEKDVEVAVRPVLCIGHAVTCGPRDHPALSDELSTQLTLPSEELLLMGPMSLPGLEVNADSDQAGAEGSTIARRLFGASS